MIHGFCCATPSSSSPSCVRAHDPSNTASPDNHEKISSWVSFCFPYMGCLWGSAWRPFGPPELRYCAENRDRILTRQKRWRTENAEILKTRLKNNKEQAIRSQTMYTQKNREHVSNYQRQYHKNIRERLNSYRRRYYVKNKEQTS